MSQYPASIAVSVLDGANGFRLDGATFMNGSGYSVASAGDVNGDGFADVIVGANGEFGPAIDTGASYVVFGKASGFDAAIDLSSLDGSDGFRLHGEAGGDNSGMSVASAGDVNGDGFDDVIVGAPYPYAVGAKPGAAYVVFGKASGFDASTDLSSLDGTNGFKLLGVTVDDFTGRSVSSAGDVNGDGYGDLIIGAYHADPNGDSSGASYVVFGKASGFDATLDLSSLDGNNGFRLDGALAHDSSGRSVASAGDVNGDGFDDIIVGAFQAGNSVGFAGSSFVVFGTDSGFAADLELSSLDGNSGFRIDGATFGDRSGSSVASAGDVNGDGYADLIIGAYNATPHGGESGASYVVFGKASGFAASMNLSDLNGTNGFKINGVAVYDVSGFTVASAGDVNGDGFDDVIVGAGGADPYGSNSGSSYVVFGKASGFAATIELSSLDGINGFRIDGAAAGDNSGRSVSSAGDVNGDGLDDLIAGAWRADHNNTDTGSSYVIFGRLPDAAVNRTGTRISQHLVGGDLGDTLSGLGGADILYGNGGADHLLGGRGADILRGGAGDDVLNGGPGFDTAYYADAPAGVTVSLALAGPQDTHGAGVDTLTAVENLVGSAFGDVLTGSNGRNTLDAGAGDDVLQGGGGVDILLGGDGVDTASYADSDAGVRVSLATKTFQNTTSEGRDKLSGLENLTGSAFDDRLTGDNGANRLDGGGGGDVLTGANGADVFVFHALGDSTLANSDLITDFTHGDLIDLHAIDANTGLGGDQAFHLGATHGHAGDIVVSYAAGPDQTTVALYVDGDKTADAEIRLSGDHTGLTAADFVL